MNRDALFSVMRLGPVWTLRHSDSNAESLEQTPPLNREGECIVPSGEYEKIVWAEGVLNAQGQLQHDKPQTQLLMNILRVIGVHACDNRQVLILGPERELVLGEYACSTLLVFESNENQRLFAVENKIQKLSVTHRVDFKNLDELLTNPQEKAMVWKQLVPLLSVLESEK